MEKAILSDKDQFPSDEIVFSHIGKNAALWRKFFTHLGAKHPDIETSWRYYNDGKSWLMKAVRKKKTVFWLSLFEDSFRTTFYFTAKAGEAIGTSGLSEALKARFADPANGGKLKNLTVVHRGGRDLEDAMILVGLKEAGS